MTALPGSLRDLGRAARQATDSQLLKIVGMVDELPMRGSADAILEPVRARLKHLRPERPLNLLRLLFLPLDPLLLDPRGWRPGPGKVPRSAIAPLAAALRAAEPRVFQAAENALTGLKFSDGQMVSELGAVLWTAAARSIPSAPPQGWTDAGLPIDAFPVIAETCKPLWRHGVALWKLRAAAPDGLREQDLRVAFRQVAQDGPEAVRTVLSALLPFSLNPAQMIALVGGLDCSLASIAEQALDRYLAGINPDFDFLDLAAVAAAAHRFALVLDDLDKACDPTRPKRAQLLHSLRQAAAGACMERLSGQVEVHLRQPLKMFITGGTVVDKEVQTLETSAIALRSIASSGRGLRRDADFEQSLSPVITLLAGALPTLKKSPECFQPVDALRILEILGGSAVAEKLAPVDLRRQFQPDRLPAAAPARRPRSDTTTPSTT